MTTTKRALDDLRKMGFTAAVVERFNTFSKRRHDLFNVIDILGIFPDFGVLGVQVTTGDHHADRRSKALAEPSLRTWLESGARFEIWSYEKQGARGKRKLWALRREEIKLEHLQQQPASMEGAAA